MRIPCPICGERDRREFYYQGDALALDRPEPDAHDRQGQGAALLGRYHGYVPRWIADH